MDRLVSITPFVRVAESGGFTAAARRLNASTAAVSENVQALENALGVRLLNRTTRRVSRPRSAANITSVACRSCMTWRRRMTPPAHCR